MKHAVIILCLLLLPVFTGCENSSKASNGGDETVKSISFETEQQKESYVVGHDLAKNYKRLLAVLDLEYFIKGFRDGAAEKKSPISEEEKQKIVTSVRTKVFDRDQKVREELGKKNKVEGEKFLKENARKDGVKVTQSGLQYMVLKEGDGPLPGSKDYVKVNYRGTLIDGTEFDNTEKRGKPITIDPNRVITGWAEGMQLMKVGSKYRFFIPPALGYGERGMGAQIGPHAVLIFDVELLSIEAPPANIKKPNLPTKVIPQEYKKSQEKK